MGKSIFRYLFFFTLIILIFLAVNYQRKLELLTRSIRTVRGALERYEFKNAKEITKVVWDEPDDLLDSYDNPHFKP